MRRATVRFVVSLVSFLTACSSAGIDKSPRTPDPTTTGSASASASATARASASGSPGKSSSGKTPTPGGSAQPTVATSVPAPSYNDDGGVGEMAKTFLRSSPARRLVVEVDWVEGREPSNDALGHLGAVIRSVVSKPGGVVVQRGSAFPAEAQRYSLQKIADVERRRRANRSSGDTATIWIAYLNGELAENEDALGVAFAASSVVIFRDQIDRATSAILLAVEIERAVIVHEAGHLLALVNIGYRSKINHEDAAHPNHSNNQESVMYWAVDSVSIRDLLGGGPPENFDAADRADLAMLRGG